MKRNHFVVLATACLFPLLVNTGVSYRQKSLGAFFDHTDVGSPIYMVIASLRCSFAQPKALRTGNNVHG